MHKDTWTIKRVKDELPMVRIQFKPDPTIHKAWLLGAKQDFASVLCGNQGPRAIFTWETIVNSLNQGKILQG